MRFKWIYIKVGIVSHNDFAIVEPLQRVPVRRRQVIIVSNGDSRYMRIFVSLDLKHLEMDIFNKKSPVYWSESYLE